MVSGRCRARPATSARVWGSAPGGGVERGRVRGGLQGRSQGEALQGDAVAVDAPRGRCSWRGRAEVGAATSEDLHPLLLGLVEGVGDQVGDVALPAPGHPHVGGGGTCGLPDDRWAVWTVSPWAPWAVVA